MHASHVVVDGHDGYTFWAGADRQLFTAESAAAFAADRNAEMKPEHALYQVFTLAPATSPADAARRKAAAVTAAVDAIEGEPGEAVTAAVRRHLEALYDQGRAAGLAQVTDLGAEYNRPPRCCI